jgi:hypothetical protein
MPPLPQIVTCCLAVLLQRYGSAVRVAVEHCLTLVVVGGIVLLVAGVMVLWLIG